MENIIIPHIEEDVPLPANATEAFPELSPKEELDARARTITLIAELNKTPLYPTAEHMSQAKEIATQMMTAMYCLSPGRILCKEHKNVLRPLSEPGAE